MLLPAREAIHTAQITEATLVVDSEETFEAEVEREVEDGAMKVEIGAVNQNVVITGTEETIERQPENRFEVKREAAA